MGTCRIWHSNQCQTAEEQVYLHLALVAVMGQSPRFNYFLSQLDTCSRFLLGFESSGDVIITSALPR